MRYKQRINEIIGEASMCWSETPTGIFNSDRGVQLADEIIQLLDQELAKREEQISDFIKSQIVPEVCLPQDDQRVLMWKGRHNKTLKKVLDFIIN